MIVHHIFILAREFPFEANLKLFAVIIVYRRKDKKLRTYKPTNQPTHPPTHLYVPVNHMFSTSPCHDLATYSPQGTSLRNKTWKQLAIEPCRSVQHAVPREQHGIHGCQSQRYTTQVMQAGVIMQSLQLFDFALRGIANRDRPHITHTAYPLVSTSIAGCIFSPVNTNVNDHSCFISQPVSQCLFTGV